MKPKVKPKLKPKPSQKDVDLAMIDSPAYYARLGVYEPYKVIEAIFAEDAHLAMAFKYMARAGHKKDSSYAQDVSKARWWLTKALQHVGAEPKD